MFRSPTQQSVLQSESIPTSYTIFSQAYGTEGVQREIHFGRFEECLHTYMDMAGRPALPTVCVPFDHSAVFKLLLAWGVSGARVRYSHVGPS